MRKKTLINIFIYGMRLLFLVLPLLCGLIFTFTRLPIGDTDWADDDDNSLNSKFETYFETCFYKPLYNTGLNNTFVYDGVSKVFNLFGFEPHSGNSYFYSSLSVDSVDFIGFGHTDFTIAEFIDFCYDVILANNNNVMPTSNRTYTVARLSSIDYYGDSRYSQLVVYYKPTLISGVLTKEVFSLYLQIPTGSSSTANSSIYLILVERNYSNGSYVDSWLSPLESRFDFLFPTNYHSSQVLNIYNYGSVGFVSNFVSLVYSEPNSDLIYIDFYILYLSYIIFVYVFELFVRVMIWLPKFAIHFLEKPFKSLSGGSDVD